MGKKRTFFAIVFWIGKKSFPNDSIYTKKPTKIVTRYIHLISPLLKIKRYEKVTNEQLTQKSKSKNKSRPTVKRKRHKTEPHPPKSLFKSEDDENFSLYVSEVTFPLTDT